MKLNSDSTKAQLEINTELDASGVEELIRALAMVRAQMAPAVPARPSGSAPTMTQDAPALLIDNLAPDGSVILRLRNIGLGWTSWRLPANDVAAVREVLESFHRQPPARATGQHQH